MKSALSCFVTREWSPSTPGGIGGAVRALVETSRDGAIVLLDQPERLVRRARRTAPSGISVVGIQELGDVPLPSHAFRSEAYFRSFRIWRSLTALVERESIDRIEFPDYEGLGFVAIKAARLALWSPLPSIEVRLHGTLERVARGDGRTLLSLSDKQRASMERYALRYASAVIAPSSEVLREYQHDYELGGQLRVEVPFVRQPACEADSPPAKSPLVLGFLGKLQPLKGAELLVRAAVSQLDAAGAPVLEVHLVGEDTPGRFEDSHRREIERQVPPRWSDRIHFHGALSREEAHRRLARCHAAVVPSVSETFGLAARELAAMGLPLALSDLPAFRSGFPESRAPLERFPVGDQHALERILLHWLAAIEEGVWPPGSSFAVSPDGGRGEREPIPTPPGRRASPADFDSSGHRPLVSIVVPYHEMHDYVEECLASIERDPYPAKEVVIVDDGSTSEAACAKLRELETRFGGNPTRRVTRKANGGLASARNAGVQASTGELILPLDPDDLIVPGYLDAAVSALRRAPELDYVVGISSLFRDGVDPDRAREWFVPYDPTCEMLLYENGAGTAAAVLRRDVLLAFPYREDLPAYEDWDLYLRLAKAGRSGEVLPVVFHRYRQRGAGLARLAHRHHDRLVERLIAPHLGQADDALRGALEIYLASVSRLRGIGETRPTQVLADRVEDVYRVHLKSRMTEWLGEARRDRLAGRVRRALRGS